MRALRRGQPGDGLRRASCVWNPDQGKRASWCVDDIAVLAPTGADHAVGYAAYSQGRPSEHRHLFELDTVEETNPLPIRRKKWVAAAFRARKERVLRLVEQARCE